MDLSLNKQLIYVYLTILVSDEKGDLSRYIAGNVAFESIRAVAVEHNDRPGRLSTLPINESEIPENDRLPRVTSALWYSFSVSFLMLGDITPEQ